jgi:hypothetical protein
LPNSITYLDWTPIIEWVCSQVWFHKQIPKDVCKKEFGLHAQNTITIIGSIVNIIGWEGDLYDQLISRKILITLIVNEIWIGAPEIMRKAATTSFWLCYLSHAN